MLLPVTLLNFLAPFVSNYYLHHTTDQKPLVTEPTQASLQFELRHFHAVTPDGSRVLFHDVNDTIRANAHFSTYSTNHGYLSPPIKTRKVRTTKPSNNTLYELSRRSKLNADSIEGLRWDEEEVVGPDVESREVLLELAKMTNNAYLGPGEVGWYDLEGQWNVSYPFGWEPDDDGFRGHVFATPDNSTVVLAIKGTSAAFIGGGGPTARKDKFNDNLLFSCCCARIDWTWTTVCGCYRGGWTCDNDCLEDALVEDSLFYPIGTNLYNNITYMYPNANIWLVGHSLGGALASLLGITYGCPAVAFESPGEKMAADRLHLRFPKSIQHVTHVYHTADPIAMGTCNGVLSSCALGGYAMESRCHLGSTIVYDTVSNLSWAVNIRTHTIVTVIEEILSQPWPHSENVGREVPEVTVQDDCVECYSWEFGDFPQQSKRRWH